MTLEDAKKLYELQEENGYSVKIDSGYIDNFAYIEEIDGSYVYSSSVFSKRSLRDVGINDVYVYRNAEEWDEYLDQKEFQHT